MTLWQIGAIAFGLVAYAVAWSWGGRPERLGAGVLLISCLLSMLAFGWTVGGYAPASMVLDSVSLLIFGWLCFRSDRWWPFVATASGVLTVLMYMIRLLDPAFSQYALVSAHVGLEFLIDLALLLGVWERGLAGEPPAARAAWAEAKRATTTRKARRAKVQPPDEPKPASKGSARNRSERSRNGGGN
ncbi:MAG: hypothetical protein HYU62_11980 [Caulobacterales bacterium]|nr:hypothetical protein [Caulobacterales bacterium]